MNDSTSQLACETPTATHPSGRKQDFELGGLQDCFFESDTEVFQANSKKVAYIAQLLSLRNIRHLSEPQIIGRRFILKMLQSLGDAIANTPQDKPVEVSGWNPALKHNLLIFLLERSFNEDLAEVVREAANGKPLKDHAIVSLGRWLDSNGLDISELGMIQPGIFRPANALPQPKGNAKFQPKFAELINASSIRNIDYLAGAFFGVSQKILSEEATPSGFGRLRKAEVSANAGRGEAIVSIFDAKVGYQAQKKTGRLKAVAIPNSGGEPLFALSFASDF